MSDTHERLWHEWYAVWHDADASKAKPSYEEWLEARIEELEKTMGDVIRLAEQVFATARLWTSPMTELRQAIEHARAALRSEEEKCSSE